MQNTANSYRLSIKLIYYKKIIVFLLYIICYTLRKKKEYKKRKYIKEKKPRKKNLFLNFLIFYFVKSNNIFIFVPRKIGKTDKSQKNGRTKKRVGRCTPGRGAQKERADPRDNRHKRKQIVCRYAQTSCRGRKHNARTLHRKSFTFE